MIQIKWRNRRFVLHQERYSPHIVHLTLDIFLAFRKIMSMRFILLYGPRIVIFKCNYTPPGKIRYYKYYLETNIYHSYGIQQFHAIVKIKLRTNIANTFNEKRLCLYYHLFNWINIILSYWINIIRCSIWFWRKHITLSWTWAFLGGF